MSELTEALRGRFLKNRNSETANRISKQQVKAALLSMCEEYLKVPGDVLTFESTKSEIPFVIEAIIEEPLKSRYYIMQETDVLFSARLIELDF